MYPAYKCNMTDLAAGMGLQQLARYDKILERRKEIIERYNCGLKQDGVEVVDHYNSRGMSSGHLYMVRISGLDENSRNVFVEKMAKYGVPCNVHYKPLPMFTAYKDLGFDIADFPKAFDKYVNEVTLPLHTLLNNKDVDYIIECFNAVFSEVKDALDIKGDVAGF